MSAETRASEDGIAARIRTLRGLRVMLDADLADLYGVSTGALVQAVKRNPLRFPPDFMFRLSEQEVRHLKSQTVILPQIALRYWGRRRNALVSIAQRSRRSCQHCKSCERSFGCGSSQLQAAA
jgi:hypothetical protein